MWFSIGGSLELSAYLAPLWRYWAPKIMGSRVWPFGVTWRHWSRNHQTRRGHFPIDGQWWPCVYLAQIRRYGDHVTSSVTWPFDLAYVAFIGGPLEPCVCLASLRSYKALKLHLPMLKSKSSLRMRRVTWPVGRGSKMTTYLVLPSPHCLFIVQLLWGYDDD